jgi:hypothetical protein
MITRTIRTIDQYWFSIITDIEMTVNRDASSTIHIPATGASPTMRNGQAARFG